MTATKDETQLREEDIYEEHQRSVKPTAHSVYLSGFSAVGSCSWSS